MGDHADDAQKIDEQEGFDHSDVLQKNLQAHVRAAYTSYPHLLNQLDIIYREAIIKVLSGQPELETCNAAKKEIDELLMEDTEDI